jgi:hypothetical protein
MGLRPYFESIGDGSAASTCPCRSGILPLFGVQGVFSETRNLLVEIQRLVFYIPARYGSNW